MFWDWNDIKAWLKATNRSLEYAVAFHNEKYSRCRGLEL
jgi:hypothetical protein